MIKQVIVVRKDLNMRKGKMCAQVAHASMAFLVKDCRVDIVELEHAQLGFEHIQRISGAAAEWFASSFPKIVVSVDSESELQALIQRARNIDIEVHPITDLGKTEFHDVPTLTCAAFGPCDADSLDSITGKCKLL